MWHEDRIKVEIVSTIEFPRCFAIPAFAPHSGRFASMPKKDGRRHPQVFLTNDITLQIHIE
ncbi:hypothetical protein HMPREF0083_02837 [Aneurinibacillus aneurinilyticus ATCC 12856]|uniref:Uncharacterized protein n=1 Tax=Aneurinibacillus aneurinilyticus ATCC 12856 TaxID=649747 RepID=U1WKD1_ANEAE|nr:hypothetical protein HMPREF0083_02837 [Aneurinibacillus aneurinilyticus ATCC 12856]